MKSYRTDEFCHKLFYETARFSAFNQQWIVKAIINNSQRDVHQTNDREISYQVIFEYTEYFIIDNNLISSVTSTYNIRYNELTLDVTNNFRLRSNPRLSIRWTYNSLCYQGLSQTWRSKQKYTSMILPRTKMKVHSTRCLCQIPLKWTSFYQLRL